MITAARDFPFRVRAAKMREPPTILIVEDERAQRVLLGRALQLNGYRVLDAADGAEALRVLDPESAAIDLVITDMRMPTLDGKQLVSAIHERFPALRVICISADAGNIDLESGDAYLVKPFTFEKLIATIREVLPAH